MEHGSSEAKEAFELKKSTRRNINNQNEGNPTNTENQDCEMSKLATQSTHTITLIDADDSALIAHCFDELENEFTDIPNLKNICRDYLTTCRAIVQLDKYFFPWNDREIVTYQDFRGISWPYLKKSVDMAHEADPEDPDRGGGLRDLRGRPYCPHQDSRRDQPQVGQLVRDVSV